MDLSGLLARTAPALFAAATGCATVSGRARLSPSEYAFCAPPPRAPGATPPVVPEPGDDAWTPVVATRYTRTSRDIADTLGATPLLARIAHAEHDHDVATLALARAQIAERIGLAELAVRSVEAELGCDHERIVMLAGAVRDAEDASTRALTVASLVVVGVTGVATSALTPVAGAAPEEAVLGIVGGVASGVLGGVALLVHTSVAVEHRRNLLREFWTGPAQSALFPDLVWAYLTDPRYGERGVASIRTQLVQGWVRRGLLGRPGVADPRRVALFFGGGGRYDGDALDTRAAMLNAVRAAVRLMAQELEELASETARGE